MKQFVLTICLLAIAAPAHAIVNLQELHTGEPEPGFSGTLALDLSGDSGNTDKSNLSFGSLLQWQRERRSNMLLLNYDYGESQGVTSSDRGFIHLRHIEQLTAPYGWEIFGQLQNDRFARLSLRSLVGGGLRVKHRYPKRTTIFGAGGFYEREKLTEVTTTSDDRSSADWRGNLYLIMDWALNEQITLYNTGYYQPRLDEPADFRLLEQAGVKVKIAERLSLRLSINLRYDSRPPQSVKDYDIHYRSGIEYSF